MITFNGARGHGCETFEIRATAEARPGDVLSRSFCKTEGAPYDICVKVALVILKHHLGDRITVASDADDRDWNDARHICQESLGYGADFPLSKE